MAVDSETKKYLEEVKKGKARKFVMICRGVKILSLVVYKKGSLERFKKQAKEEGKGKFYHGVVDGKGLNIHFKLRRSDGYEKPPSKELILKDYLLSEADMRFKPVYEIVNELPDVDASDEDVATIDTVVRDESHEHTSVDGPPTTDETAVIKRRLKALAPAIQQVRAQGGFLGQELDRCVKTLKDLRQRNELVKANAVLDRMEQLIDEASTKVDPATAKPVDETQRADDERWQDLLAEIEPKYRKAISETLGKDEHKITAQMRVIFDFARDKAESDEFDNAINAIKRLTPLFEQFTEAEAKLFAFPKTRFDRVMPALQPEIRSLRDLIKLGGHDKHPDSLCNRLENRLQAFCDELRDDVDRGIRNRDARIVDQLKQRVQSNTLVRHLAGNPFTKGEVFVTTILGALDDVGSQLAS
jgi:hypothetical protein